MRSPPDEIGSVESRKKQRKQKVCTIMELLMRRKSTLGDLFFLSVINKFIDVEPGNDRETVREGSAGND